MSFLYFQRWYRKYMSRFGLKGPAMENSRPWRKRKYSVAPFRLHPGNVFDLNLNHPVLFHNLGHKYISTWTQAWTANLIFCCSYLKSYTRCLENIRLLQAREQKYYHFTYLYLEIQKLIYLNCSCDYWYHCILKNFNCVFKIVIANA